MSEALEKTISLAPAEVDRIESLVSSGVYPSASEVVHEALITLEERNSSLEDWLREEVGPVYDAYHADPSRGIPAEEVFDQLRAHHEKRTEKSA
jgi:antitoxin ParD1/3/4